MHPKHAATRREFLELSAVAIGGASVLQGQVPTAAQVPRRPFGQSGEQVSILGVGGFHLGSAKDLADARQIVDTALDAGVNFFDCAWEYHKGQSEEWLGESLKGKRDRAFVMTKVCTHGRSKKIAMQMLEEMVRHGGVTAADALSYALSLPVTVTVSGMESMAVLQQNLAIARGFRPLSAAAMQTLRDQCRTDAADGRWELFKTTKKYDGDLGREQHGFPPATELPA